MTGSQETAAMTGRDEFGKKPFTPGAGRTPPYLAGRDRMLDW